MPNTIHLEDFIGPDAPPVTVMPAYHTTLSRHDHDFYELVYVTGGFCLHDTGGAVTLLMEGDIFILKPWVSHKYVGNRVTRIYNCLFRADALGEALGPLTALPGLDKLFSPDLNESAPSLHLTLGERKTAVRLIEGMLLDLTDRPVGWPVRVKALLTSLLVEYARAYQAHVGGEPGEAAYSAYVAQAMSLIEERYADHSLTVAGIAAQVGVSADYLSRQFRLSTGIAAQEYLRRYRFARAIALLQSDMPVGESAAQVGFSSLAHFSREFRREMGVSPSQYRTRDN